MGFNEMYTALLSDLYDNTAVIRWRLWPMEITRRIRIGSGYAQHTVHDVIMFEAEENEEN